MISLEEPISGVDCWLDWGRLTDRGQSVQHQTFCSPLLTSSTPPFLLGPFGTQTGGFVRPSLSCCAWASPCMRRRFAELAKRRAHGSCEVRPEPETQTAQSPECAPMHENINCQWAQGRGDLRCAAAQHKARQRLLGSTQGSTLWTAAPVLSPPAWDK